MLGKIWKVVLWSICVIWQCVDCRYQEHSVEHVVAHGVWLRAVEYVSKGATRSCSVGVPTLRVGELENLASVKSFKMGVYNVLAMA